MQFFILIQCLNKLTLSDVCFFVCSSRHYTSKFRKYSLQEDPGWRKRSGTELESLGSARGASRRVSIQPEDATLEEVDIDDLDSHRSDDARAFRRKKSSRSGSFVHISRKDETGLRNVLSTLALKKMYDHSPHAVSFNFFFLLNYETYRPHMAAKVTCYFVDVTFSATFSTALPRDCRK